jgi:UDP-N-acetylglucosamine 2-epimerase
MRKILVVTADRSEHGLLVSVFEELSKRKDVIVQWCILDSREDASVNLLIFSEKLEDFKPQIILLPCDRNEMVYPAAYAFQNGFVNFHYHAGNFSSSHPDDFNRRAISLYSHIMLCNWEEHKDHLIKQGEEESRIFVVGSTAFDNIEFDYSKVPEEPFDLVVLHPTPNSEAETKHDLMETLRTINASASETMKS